jgi:hypothetical protein
MVVGRLGRFVRASRALLARLLFPFSKQFG